MAINVHKSLVNCLKWSATQWMRILMLVRISLKSNLSRAHAHTQKRLLAVTVERDIFLQAGKLESNEASSQRFN